MLAGRLRQNHNYCPEAEIARGRGQKLMQTIGCDKQQIMGRGGREKLACPVRKALQIGRARWFLLNARWCLCRCLIGDQPKQQRFVKNPGRASWLGYAEHLMTPNRNDRPYRSRLLMERRQ
jgi:hypothetical protein